MSAPAGLDELRRAAKAGLSAPGSWEDAVVRRKHGPCRYYHYPESGNNAQAGTASYGPGGLLDAIP